MITHDNVHSERFFLCGKQQRSEFEDADGILYRSLMDHIKYYEFLSFSDMESNRFNCIRCYTAL